MTTLNTRKSDMLAAIPRLRAFAISLAGSVDKADDLVQETLLKAWGSLDSFQQGTNMPAWLFTILRNVFYSDFRKKRREVQDTEGQFASTLATPPAQSSHMDLSDFQSALQMLPDNQREALLLVGASGMSYEEVAEICGCAIGTIKSRVNRARARLQEILSISSNEEFSTDAAWQTTLNASIVTHQLARH
jgi:RNA polymerase sigma-70 factor (ECF subfamily)